MPILRYTLLRLVVLAAVLGVLWLVGMRGWLLLAVAFLVAALVSFLVLPRQANDAAAVIARRRGGRTGAMDAAIAQDAAEEDALLDREHREDSDGPRG
ncbi:DUF4229 domain-containing protein [Georgenia wutianyii]|uniref:DUF4229 domain-containing protein n=1 Tax=Georgenia wutianyii TaxID=2585135 RepID=A0ABX5VP86_9MICO|nr:DUF4229 domain-containing protein [Georgenia wutianyii]QDB80307.1 DUF4229 domain-containing protein [Georgenia wutianyii]